MIQPAPVLSPRNRRVNSPDRGSADGILQREGTDKGVPGVVLGAGGNVGILVVFTKDGDDDARWLVFRRCGSTDRYDALPWYKRVRRMSLVNYPLSGDWMEGSHERGKWLSPEEHIVKFG